MKLHNYWRSSSSWRVRIALAYKEIPYEYVAVDILGGAHRKDSYGRVNPMHELPTLEDNGIFIGQSLAIIQYLEERFPARPIYPRKQPERAYAWQIAEIVNSSVQPLQNLRVLQKLEADFGLDADKRKAWAASFIGSGLKGLETVLALRAGSYCVGEEFSLADCCLAPQLYNARRFSVDVAAYPTIARLEATLLAHPAVIAAHPSAQPDAVPE